MKKLIAVVGMSGTGKSVATTYLEDQGYKKIYFGGVIYDKMKEAGIEITPDSQKEFRENLFSTLTIVDFSKKSDMLLVKEKIGSGVRGIYQSYVWVYYMQGEQTNWSAKKFDILNETIKNYHAKNSHIALNNYRWDIRPLGFSKEKPNIVITEAFAWDKDKKEIFLGLWGLDTNNASVNLISKKQTPIEVSANGIIVKEFLP